MPDITMNVDDTLELDTIIEESTRSSNPVTNVDSSFEQSGIQTHTHILNPTKPGDYTIKVNGQELSIKVNDTSTIPDSAIYYWETPISGKSDGDSVSNWPATVGSDMSTNHTYRVDSIGTRDAIDGNGSEKAEASIGLTSSELTGNFSFGVSFSANDGNVLAGAEQGSGERFVVALGNTGLGPNASSGELAFRIFDGSNDIEVSTSGLSLDDGVGHDCLIRKDGDSDSDVDFVVDGSSVSKTVLTSGTVSSIDTFSDIGFWDGLDGDGSFQGETIDADVASFRFYNDYVTSGDPAL